MPTPAILLTALLISMATAGGQTIVKGTPHAIVWIAEKVSHPVRHPKSAESDMKKLVHRMVAE